MNGKCLVTFFSATIDGRDLIFGHKLHIGTPYRGKRFLTRQIPTSCLPKSGLVEVRGYIFLFTFHREGHSHFHLSSIFIIWCFIGFTLELNPSKKSNNKMNCELMLTYDTPALWQTGSRNLTGQKTLPTILAEI
jgi:hypothetical protein